MKAEPCTIAYIGLGSNLNNPSFQIISAFASLSTLPVTQLEKRSSLYRSKPMGPQNQPDYINAVAAVCTSLSPQDLLDHLKIIEELHGRVRNEEKWGPRTLDLDLLLYGDLQINESQLIIPHPGLHERNFVLYPLSEIAPDVLIPKRGRIKSLMENINGQDIQRIPVTMNDANE